MSHSNPVLGNIFSQSGIFSYVIAALTIALGVTLVLQHLRRDRVDYGPVLWGLVAALFFAGLAGTLAGQYQLFRALARLEEAQLTRLLLKGWAISIGPMVMATPLCMLGAAATGILTHRARRARAALSAPVG
jgi:hypothetical protein